MPNSPKTPELALAELKAGNERFLGGEQHSWDWLGLVKETAGGQTPFAVVLGCIDSRVPHEVVFDQGIGNLFSIRIAGNFANADVLGSMEFATAISGAKLVLVLGHTACGAIQGATDAVKLGNLTGMLDHVMPAVESLGTAYGERASTNAGFVDAAAGRNVELTVEYILHNSPVIAGLVEEGKVAVVGAMYDVGSGTVTFHE